MTRKEFTENMSFVEDLMRDWRKMTKNAINSFDTAERLRYIAEKLETMSRQINFEAMHK